MKEHGKTQEDMTQMQGNLRAANQDDIIVIRIRKSIQKCIMERAAGCDFTRTSRIASKAELKKACLIILNFSISRGYLFYV
jgi:hypothetical protein